MKLLKYFFTTVSIAVLLQACDHEPTDPVDILTRSTWVADTVYTTDYSKAVNKPLVKMDRTNEKFYATGGCNDITGTYRLTGKKIFFKEFSDPVEFCETTFETEQMLVYMLKNAFTWEIKEGKLYFYYKSTTIGVFRKKEDD